MNWPKPFPQYDHPLLALRERLFDLLPIIRGNYKHPAAPQQFPEIGAAGAGSRLGLRRPGDTGGRPCFSFLSSE